MSELERIIFERFDFRRAMEENGGSLEGVKVKDLPTENVEIVGVVVHEGSQSLLIRKADSRLIRIQKEDIRCRKKL